MMITHTQHLDQDENHGIDVSTLAQGQDLELRHPWGSFLLEPTRYDLQGLRVRTWNQTAW